jgi:curved DNA-binding protein CbpA
MEGTPLDRNGTSEEQEQARFKLAKQLEIDRLARAEAKAEREAKRKLIKK